MSFPVIESTIEIDAPPSKVWRVFTDPAVTRRMGGEYVSGWQPGGAFGWKGADGTMLTNGTILDITPEKLLQHDLRDNGRLLSVITYELIPHQEKTLVAAREELHYTLTEEQLLEAEEGWEIALRAVKDLAENI